MLEFMSFRKKEHPFSFSSPESHLKADIKENKKDYTIKIDLPGFSKNDIDISVDDSYLVINARRCYGYDNHNKEGTYIHRERAYGKFSRKFNISGIRRNKITGEYANGVLVITLPKKHS